MRMNPRVCQPFTLSYGDSGLVRVEASNRFDRLEGPLGKDARTLNYTGERKVIAHIPPRRYRLELAGFLSAHHYKCEAGSFARRSVCHGRGRERAYCQAWSQRRFSVPKAFRSDVRRLVRKSGQATESSSVPGRGQYRRAGDDGLAVGRTLLSVDEKNHWSRRSTANAFQKAAHDRYGKESLKAGRSTRWHSTSFWLYDLSGKRLDEDDASPANSPRHSGSLAGIARLRLSISTMI